MCWRFTWLTSHCELMLESLCLQLNRLSWHTFMGLVIYLYIIIERCVMVMTRPYDATYDLILSPGNRSSLTQPWCWNDTWQIDDLSGTAIFTELHHLTQFLQPPLWTFCILKTSESDSTVTIPNMTFVIWKQFSY